MDESISAAIARTSSCWVMARPSPRRLPSTSRKYFNLSESFMSITDCNNYIAICDIAQRAFCRGRNIVRSRRGSPERAGASGGEEARLNLLRRLRVQIERCVRMGAKDGGGALG